MIQISADTRRAVVTNKELLTVGSAGIQVQFTLSEDWDSLAKLAVFRIGDEGEKVDVALGESLTCVVPPEVLTEESEVLFIGIYGSNGQGTVIIPTVWASAGVVKPGTEPNTPAESQPTPEIWAQILGVANDAERTATEAMSMVEAGLQDLSELEGTVETAEAQRQTNEQARVTAEGQRATAENVRTTAETGRVDAESARVTSEQGRVAAEESRIEAENARVSAEASRVTAEEGRVAAEAYREEKYAEYVTTVQSYADAASASATAAAGSATSAAGSASAASTSAGQASSSATAASTSASQASSSASSASTSATTASNAATTATTQAGIATTKAGEAASSATAAVSAKTAAETAQGKAEDAQEEAEAAAQSIEESAAQIAQNTQDISDVKNAIDTKAPVIINTASGDIVTFADGADGMPIKHLVASIEAVQEGSGDPSPTNVRPITGWTGLSGQACGKNLLPNKKYQDTSIRVRLGVDNGTDIGFFKAGTYKFSIDSSVAVTPYFRQIEGGTQGEVHQIVNGNVVIPTDGHYRFWVFAESISVSDINWFQLELGSTASAYEEHQGQTISVSWATEAGTVYGGTLDVVTGELTVTHAIVEFDGSSDEQWGKGDYENYRIQINGMPVVPVSTMGILACNRLKPIAFNDRGSTTVPCIMCEGSEASIELRRLTTLNITTVAELRTWLSNNPVSAVYPLATPQIYQLDPVTVSTLLGNNTVYVDCGSVTVDYPADTGIVVADQSNAISQKQDATNYVTLSGTIVTQTGADNTMYLCGELAELTFTAPATGITAIRFTSGTTPTVVTFSGVTWLNGFDPTAIEASKTYEINILNGLGCAAWT